MNFPNKKYQVIYADPPQHFQNWNNATAQTNPNHHYNTMSMEEIAKLPVNDIADDNCVLFMWCTDPLLHKQIPIVEQWGFTYKTVAFYWIKTNKDKVKNYYFKGAEVFGLEQIQRYVFLRQKVNLKDYQVMLIN